MGEARCTSTSVRRPTPARSRTACPTLQGTSRARSCRRGPASGATTPSGRGSSSRPPSASSPGSATRAASPPTLRVWGSMRPSTAVTSSEKAGPASTSPTVYQTRRSTGAGCLPWAARSSPLRRSRRWRPTYGRSATGAGVEPESGGAPLEPGPRRPEAPDDHVVVYVILPRQELVVLQALVEQELVLRCRPDIQALAHRGIRVHVVQLAIPRVGDELARRRERLEMGELLGGVGDLLVESRGRQELLRCQRGPVTLGR